eukprot:2209336-Rhodomonas_salina.1
MARAAQPKVLCHVLPLPFLVHLVISFAKQGPFVQGSVAAYPVRSSPFKFLARGRHLKGQILSGTARYPPAVVKRPGPPSRFRVPRRQIGSQLDKM